MPSLNARSRPIVQHYRIAAVALLASLAAVPSSAGTLATVHALTGGADGATPYKGVTLDKSGTIHGVTTYGANACPDTYFYAGTGCGVLFKQRS